MRSFLKILLFSLMVASVAYAKGPDFSIFQVRRQLALSNDQKTEKDFYIYAGSEEGVKPNTVYDVIRKVPLYDGYQNRSLGELTVKVAQVKVILVDKNISVARYYKDFSRESLPVLKDDYILLGDMIDVSTESKVAENRQDTPKENSEEPQGIQLVINSIDVSNKLDELNKLSHQ